MSLIRNGGFERGNIDFWTVETDGTLEIDNINQKNGVYCGKYISGHDNPQEIVNNDYIAVPPFNLIALDAWVKTDAIAAIQPIIYCYDADYSYIKTLRGYYRNMDGTYLELNTQISVMQGVSYIRAGIGIQYVTSGNAIYIDGYTCSIINPEDCISGTMVLLNLEHLTASGNTTEDKKEIQMYKSFEADLMVSSVSGTTPTLDISVYEENLLDREVLLGAFAQASAITKERITLTHCTGSKLYIRYTITGTDADFRTMVSVTGKG